MRTNPPKLPCTFTHTQGSNALAVAEELRLMLVCALYKFKVISFLFLCVKRSRLHRCTAMLLWLP